MVESTIYIFSITLFFHLITPIAHVVQTALECTHLHLTVLLFPFVLQLKSRSCMVCAIRYMPVREISNNVAF